MANREEGFYWVKTDFKNNWEVAQWYCGCSLGCFWLIAGNEEGLNDCDFEEIDENRITRNGK